MNYYEEISENLKHIKQVEKSIEQLKETYKDNPMLLEFYMPSTQELLESLKFKLNTLMQEYIGGVTATPDIWIRLQGKVFDNGRAPLGVVAAFINKLVRANQHAVALLEQVKYEGVRINNKIKELAELDLVATAPGSLKLGIKKSSIEKFYKYESDAQEMIKDENYILQCVEEANRNSYKAIEGLQLLTRAIIATTDEEELTALSQEIQDPKNLLKLFYYAREITPTKASEIENITFSGVTYNNTNYKEVVISKETRANIKAISQKLLGQDKYIEGIGTVRALDLDKFTFRIDSLRFDKTYLENVECKLNEKEFSEHDLEGIANKQIRLLGILSYSNKGLPKNLEVDKIFFEEEDNNEED